MCGRLNWPRHLTPPGGVLFSALLVMCPKLPHLWRYAAIVFAALAAGRAHGELAKTSPFLPPQAANASGPTAGAPLEFRGTIQTAAGTLFRVHDPARKTGIWLKLNERDSTLDVLAKQHDSNQNTLTVEYQGKTITLAGRESKIVSSGNAAQPMPLPPPMAQPVVGPAVTQSVVVNPSPADEQRRLEAVAAEVARRRALREQASQQIGQGGTPMIVPGQPQAIQPQMQPQIQPPQQRGQTQFPQGFQPKGPPPQGRQQR